jgi:hypothetical protein
MKRAKAPVSCILAVMGLATLLVAAPACGEAIYTSLFDGLSVDQNLYDNKDDVYLNGGPQNPNGPGFPDGFYYFMVTDPSGAVLLSTDPIADRACTVAGGVISGVTGSGGTHAVGLMNPNNHSISVQLIPFSKTPSSGGEYKVWLTAAGDYNPQASNSTFGFKRSKSHTDNFKVADDIVVPEPGSLLALGMALTGLVGSGRRGQRRA